MKNTDRHYDGVSQLTAALLEARNRCPEHNHCHDEKTGNNEQCIYYNFDKMRGKNKPDCLYRVFRRASSGRGEGR